MPTKYWDSLRVSLLLDRWAQVREGRGRVVLLSGEAGSGKSPLVQVLREQISGSAATRLECRCSPSTQHSALYPVIAHVEWVLALAHNDTPDDKVHKLETALAPYSWSLPQVCYDSRETQSLWHKRRLACQNALL